MIEHHIQKDIIERLATAPSLRFSELKPDGLESNAFIYHLKQLIEQKLVEKTEHGYQLSVTGLTYIDSFSFHTHKLRKQPKVISILAIHNSKGQWLMAKRKYQPYIDKLMLPSGKQHFGESPERHAERELNEKIGWQIPLKRRGLADIRIFHGDHLITHITAHVYEGICESEAVPDETHQFSYVWKNIESHDSSLLFGTEELITKLQNEPDLFFLSLDVGD